jgi:hypothetical protein
MSEPIEKRLCLVVRATALDKRQLLSYLRFLIKQIEEGDTENFTAYAEFDDAVGLAGTRYYKDLDEVNFDGLGEIIPPGVWDTMKEKYHTEKAIMQLKSQIDEEFDG